MNTLLTVLLAILSNQAVQGALATIIVALLGLAIKHFAWTRHIAHFATEAYEYAQEQGFLQGLKGYEKFNPFMQELIRLYREKYGVEPSPEVKGEAVKVMEGLVAKEPGK